MPGGDLHSNSLTREKGESSREMTLFDTESKQATICIWCVFLFHLLYVVGFFETVGLFLNEIRMRAISFGLIALLTIVANESGTISKKPFYKLLLAVIAVLISGYLIFFYERFEYRIGSAVGFEVPLGILAIILVLELTRLTVGKAMVVLVLVFVCYVLFGEYVPGFFSAPPSTLRLLSGQAYIGVMGIYGIPLGTIIDYIFSFLLFGYALDVVGGIDFFQQIALKVFGKVRGAGAKSAVLINFFIGMIQGSSVAATILSGPFTIPRMREEGYSEAYMGGIIAAAANAAQLMPPVMGIVAFVMASLLNMPYVQLCIAAFVPGILYYLAIFLSADIEAARKGIRPKVREVREDSPAMKELMINNMHCIAGFVLLVILLSTQILTVKLSVAIASFTVLGLAGLRAKSRPSIKKLLMIPTRIGRDLITIAPVCGAAGIVIACMGTTSLDYRFSVLLTEHGGANLLVILIYASILCCILGMALPTLPAYIVVVLLVAPPLSKLGVPPIVTHMFVFYMAMTAMVTPPVCLNVYAACAMVESSIWGVGLQALRVAALSYIIPFMFVYKQALLLHGSTAEIIWAVFSGVILVIGLTFVLNWHGLTNAHLLEVLFTLPGVFLIFFPVGWLSGPISCTIGGTLLFIVAASQIFRRRKALVYKL
jgi:TRAP transporter 4TM/12TM fusion protein